VIGIESMVSAEAAAFRPLLADHGHMANTSSRSLTLLSLLQSRRDWPGALLADRLGVSPRTVRRDVDRLRALGYRIRAIKGPEGGYRLEAGAELPPLLFDDDQAIAIAVALQAAALPAAGVEDAAFRALATVRQMLPARLRHRLDALRFTVAQDAAAPVATEMLAAISSAIDAREELRFGYARVGDDTEAADALVVRRTQPHHLVAASGRWYVIGWDATADDWRIFRADRMRLRSHRGARFVRRQVPGEDPDEFLRSRFHGTEVGAPWACEGTVVLAAPASAVAPFAGDGTVTPLDAASCRLRAGAWSWASLAASVLRFDVEIHEADPPELRQALGVLSERAARAALTPAGS